ncbi:MAG: S8 family serine peptidase [Phycisphaerae bacterium]
MNRRHCVRRGWALIRAIVLAGVLATAGSASAADGTFYARGKSFVLQRSASELGIKLRPGILPGAVRSEMDFLGVGDLEDHDGGRSHYRILRVANTTTQTRAAAAQVDGVEWVRPVYRIPGVDSPLISTGRLVVCVAPGVADQQARQLFDEHGLSVVQPFEGLAGTYVLQPTADVDGAEIQAAQSLYADARVDYAHPDFAALALPRQVNAQDEFFPMQWHLTNNGQGGGTPGADINVQEAWAITLGQDVTVGALDDCCDVDHDDLRNNYINVGQDIVDGDDDPRPAQIGDRHGTSVMGLMCAIANDVGVRGVAPNAAFTITRGLGFTTFSETASAYTFARQQNVDVHNNSWGYTPGFPTPDIVADAIQTSTEVGRDGKGMVVLFASGNDGRELPNDISGLPFVIAVGATNATDLRSSFSNFGSHLDIMGPSNFGEEATSLLPMIVTTDNTDDAGYAEPGYNFGGLDDFGLPNLTNPDYTQDFGGTSAACPITAGVAALVLSANPELTSTQVRVLLEHTADRVSPNDAAYDGVTTRSNTYGYGRVNAGAAVTAAAESVSNQNLTWPDRVSSVVVIGDTLSWTRGSETKNMLIVRADTPFAWTPTDNVSYDLGQEVTPGVTVDFKDTATATSHTFTPPDFGTTFFGIFAQNDRGRYSWGVLVDSLGNVTDAGPSDTGDTGTGIVDPGGVAPINEEPKISIDVSPRSGASPLEVTFQGNALTDTDIVSAIWDFGDGSGLVEARDTTHTYEVNDGTTRRFIATFTVEDADGDMAERSVAIDVASSNDDGSASGDGGSVQISVTDVSGNAVESTGSAPLEVRLVVETDGLPGVFNSIQWDLGDGTSANTLTVVHTYDQPGTYGVTATVFTCHATNGCRTTDNPNGTTWIKSDEAFITVLASATSGSGGDQAPPAPGLIDSETSLALSTGRNAESVPCGVGLMPLWLGMIGLVGVRRWIR